MKTNPECYGGIFPDVTHPKINQPMSGRVFSAHLKSSGLLVQKRVLKTDAAAWSQCLDCASYRSCYDLSLGKLLLALALG